MSVYVRRSAVVAAGFSFFGLIIGGLWGSSRVLPKAPEGVAASNPTSLKGASTGAPAEASPASPWLDSELMVAARDGESLAQVAADHGARLRRPVGPSGYGAVVVPEGQAPELLRAELLADPRVRSADRAGRLSGAGRLSSREVRTSEMTTRASPVEVTTTAGLSWHLSAIGAPTVSTSQVRDYVVAVVDTGVAYENYKSGDVQYKVASSLSGSSFVAPYDFVNDDTHANDDHQHGTHIASLIASTGSYTGVVPGVSLMPLKVLDASSQGSEVDLIDALYHASDNGAHVINLSLTFSEGYAPSAALLDAIQYAWDMGVVMVAAAGNEGGSSALYPAASPLVLSVGATTPAGRTGQQVAWYSNTGATLDLVAPGGDLSADRDGNGVKDGVLAETFDPTNPKRFGGWLFEGSSQAAALVSGAAVLAIRAGASDPLDVALALQDGAGASVGAVALTDGLGTGSLSVSGAVSAVPGLSAVRPTDEVLVASLPWLASLDGGAQVQPMVQVTALTGEGEALAGATMLVSFWGSGGEALASCQTDADGVCTVEGPQVSARGGSGEALPLAFAFGVDGATYADRVIFRPGGALFASDALVAVVEALDDSGQLDGALLAWRWDAGDDGSLGALADAYMLVDAGAGATSRPVGVLFTPEALGEEVTTETVTLDMDATGLFSDPLGLISAKLVTLSGSGLFSDPLGLRAGSLLVLSATGLFSDPLGFGAQDVYSNTGWSLAGAGLFSDPLGFSGGAVSLKAGATLSGSSLDGTALGDHLAAGGWVSEDGTPGGALLATSLTEE